MLAISGLLGIPGPASRELIVNLTYLVIGAPTLIALHRASRSESVDPHSRKAWRRLLITIGTYWSADALWSMMAIVNGSRPPLSVADLLYTSFFPLALWSLGSFPGLGPTRAERVRVQLDAVIAAVTAGTVMYWLWPVDPAQPGLLPLLTAAVNLGYPLADVMLLSASLVLLSRQTKREQINAISLLFFAFALKTFADLIYARTVIGDSMVVSVITDVAWFGWYGLVTFAAMRAGALTPDEDVQLRAARRTGWLPYVSVGIVGALMLVLVQMGDLVPVRGVVVGLLLLLGIVLVRQAVVIGENGRLDRLAESRIAENRLAALVKHASDLIFIVDVDGTTRYVSPSVEHLTGFAASDLLGRDIVTLVHPNDVDAARLMLDKLAGNPKAQETIVLRAATPQATHGGEWRWLEVVGTNRLERETIEGLVLNARDVTERRELEGKIAWQAFHDPLTGLANRVLFSDRVTHALARRERVQVEIGVIFIDLDHFKAINDTLGHAAGDELLRQAARRIEVEVRAADTVARLGGDEFAVLLEDSDVSSCMATADRLLSQLTRPFSIEGRDVFVGASIGLSEALPGVTLEELVRDADAAMYVAKAEGRGRVVRFETAMREKVADRAELETDLRRAIGTDELQVHYQPLVDLQSGEILGAEALLRWHHPVRGLISPVVFVPIAEEAGLISEITRRVLRTACRDAKSWRTPGYDEPTLHVAVNISGRHLQEPNVVDDVREALEQTGFDPSQLTIEMTESVMMHNADTVIAAMKALKELGVTLALDDFGTGYSSLSYLQRFPIDVLKIDRSFIKQLGGSASDDALTRAILSLGETLGLATVAEGIEGEAQLAELQSLGCTMGQGYLMSKPLNGPAFARLVATGEPLHRPHNMPTPSRGTPLVP